MRRRIYLPASWPIQVTKNLSRVFHCVLLRAITTTTTTSQLLTNSNMDKKNPSKRLWQWPWPLISSASIGLLAIAAKPEATTGVGIQRQILGRDVGHRRLRRGQARSGQATPVAGQHPDRAGQDGQRHEQQRAAAQAAAAAPPHGGFGVGSLISVWVRSAGRVVSTAYSRLETMLVKAAWLCPTNRRPRSHDQAQEDDPGESPAHLIRVELMNKTKEDIIAKEK